MKVSRYAALVAVFSALLVVSLYGCYYFYGMPSKRTWNKVDLMYKQTADYTYRAIVKPSLLYDNRTEITEGEPLYTKLVEQLEITLHYELYETPTPVEMRNLEISYDASATLSGGDWSKNYHLNSMTTSTPSFTRTYTIDMNQIEETIETIGEETETRIYTYTYELRPSITLETSVGSESIREEFIPELKLTFEGGQIEVEGLKKTKAGSITHPETEIATWNFLGWSLEVPAMRLVATITSISLLAALFPPLRYEFHERASRTFIDRLDGDIREKIIEASEPPAHIERVTIRVGSLEDLAKIADEAFKTIIHHEGLFIVLDSDVRYEYKKESEETPREPESSTQERDS